MTISGQEPPEQVAAVPIPPRAALSSDDALAARLRGFGPLGIVSIFGILAGNLLVVPFSAVLVLLWARRSHTPWRAIGYVRPVSWARDTAVGVCFGAALKVLMKAVVMPLLGAGPTNAAYHHLVGNSAALPGMFYAVIVGAGFGEETVFRGYMFERLGRLFGAGVWAKVSIVMFTSALFGLAHYLDQGLAGVQQATVVGLLFGAIFAATGRIWLLMCAHAAFDVIAVAIIYWNLEYAVAHLVFN